MKKLISGEIFSDFLRCEHKAYLKLHNKHGELTEYESIQNKLRDSYKGTVKQKLSDVSCKKKRRRFLTPHLTH
jgi:hypothetical protein